MENSNISDNQDLITYNERALIIINSIKNLPQYNPYYSKYMMVLICTAGKLQMEYDGQPITIHPGGLFLSVPDSILGNHRISKNFDCKILAVNPSEIASSHEMHSKIINSMLYIKSHPVVQLSATDYANIFDYYQLISKRVRHPQHRYKDGEIRTLFNAFLLAVIGIMDSEMDTSKTTSTVRSEHIVENFAKMVNDNHGRIRLVEYYAEKLNITPKYLSTLVRSTLDRTPMEIITAVTIKEIERKLRYSSDSIKEISVSLNFSNTSFFSKYFKQHTGMTPMGYRKKYLK